MQYYKTDRQAVIDDDNKRKHTARFHGLREGQTVLRVLPPYSEEGLWFRPILEYFFKIDEEVIILTSPVDFGGDDPIRNFERKLVATGEMAQQELAKAIRPRRRFLVNAIIITDPDKGPSLFEEGVKVVALPVKVKEQITQMDIDEAAGYADLTNPETGFNLTVTRQGKGLNTSYSVMAHRQPSNIFQMAAERGIDPNTWELQNLTELAAPDTPARLKEVLDRFLATSPLAEAAGIVNVPVQAPAPQVEQQPTPAPQAPLTGGTVAPMNTFVPQVAQVQTFVPQEQQTGGGNPQVSPVVIPHIPPPPVDNTK